MSKLFGNHSRRQAGPTPAWVILALAVLHKINRETIKEGVKIILQAAAIGIVLFTIIFLALGISFQKQ